MNGNRVIGIAILAGFGASSGLAQGDDFAFMPPGGKSIFVEALLPGDAAGLAEAAARKARVEEWAEWARQQNPDLSQAAVETFAGYAALNFPVTDDVAGALAERGDVALLPRDGKELAIAQCQFCHSLFTGYLMQDRGETSWKGTFKAPFHAEIPMSEVERDTFAHYSAINMPLKFEDVPPELRF
ncbi:hypothetical protein DEA8626_02344 [Defluviimonas aquaemixtae]|uniref:Uncharacterized protein n=1 Tax=Albidovulum aquaemixtae TaxID=1542388 RepID=A0A2R8B8B6_9RHOB|nr:hypothetical protein [Defluviimonas aquaemixtae]SPH18799.1 hypothetical protein DEA8626_02344 [Defluviimonas aquaemixtae]